MIFVSSLLSFFYNSYFIVACEWKELQGVLTQIILTSVLLALDTMQPRFQARIEIWR